MNLLYVVALFVYERVYVIDDKLDEVLDDVDEI